MGGIERITNNEEGSPCLKCITGNWDGRCCTPTRSDIRSGSLPLSSTSIAVWRVRPVRWRTSRPGSSRRGRNICGGTMWVPTVVRCEDCPADRAGEPGGPGVECPGGSETPCPLRGVRRDDHFRCRGQGWPGGHRLHPDGPRMAVCEYL